MTKRHLQISIWLATLFAIGSSMIVVAEDAPETFKTEQPEQIISEGLISLGDQSSLSIDVLEEQRAKANVEIHKVTVNDQDQNGVVSNNTAIGNTSGDNILSGNAFAGATGFNATVQNSGNNVLIQNSTIINVAIEP